MFGGRFLIPGQGMSELIQLLRALDPNMGILAVLCVALLLGAPKVWAWFTTVYYPQRQKLDEMRLAAELEREKVDSATLVIIRDTMMEIRSFMIVLSERIPASPFITEKVD